MQALHSEINPNDGMEDHMPARETAADRGLNKVIGHASYAVWSGSLSGWRPHRQDLALDAGLCQVDARAWVSHLAERLGERASLPMLCQASRGGW